MNVKKVNTKYLKQAYDRYQSQSLGTTDVGTDFEPLMPYIEQELFEREAKAFDKAQRQQSNDLEAYERHHANIRTCTICKSDYPIEAIATHFSKVSGTDRYRSACKPCHAEKARQRRAINKIEAPF